MNLIRKVAIAAVMSMGPTATFADAGEPLQDQEAPLPDYAFSLISENEILTRFNRRTAESEFVAQYNAWSRGHLGAGIAFIAGREMTIDSDDLLLHDSNDFGGLALRLTRREIVLSAEMRYASDLRHATNDTGKTESPRTGPDHRLRLNRWRRTTIGLARLPGFSFLNESWIDAEWLPFRNDNGIFNAADVIGLRAHLSPELAVDLYLEPFVLLDANRTYDNNRLEMRGTFRLTLTTGNISLQPSAAAVHNYDLDRGDFPENKNPKSVWSRRFALVLLGNL
jgi:hypothetical protein